MKYLMKAAAWMTVAMIVAAPAVHAMQTLSHWLEGAINGR